MSEIDVRDGLAAIRERVASALRLESGEWLERAYIFEPVERQGVAFLLALVTKRLGDGRLEMTALGSRADGPSWMNLEFARRARFPEDVLPSILTELIDRCDVEAAAYREVELGFAAGNAPEEQVAALVDQLLPSDGAT